MFDKIKKFLFVNTNTKQIIAKNTFWLFLGEIVSRILKILLIIYATRVLGASGWGEYSYALSLIGMFTIFADIGLSSFIIRYKDHKDYAQYLSTAFSIKIILLIITLVSTLIFAPIASTIPEIRPLIPILTFMAILDSARAFILSLSRSLEKMEYEGINKIISGFILSILGILFLQINPTAENLSWSYLITSIISIFFVIHIFKSFNIKFRLHKNKIKEVWSFTWPITAIGLFATIMFSIDTYMLGIWQDSKQIGLYSATQRLVQFFYVIPGLFGTIFLPFFIKTSIDDTDKLKVSANKVMKVMLLLAIPITLAVMILSKSLIFQFFGNNYLSASITLKILVISVIFVFPNFILDSLIISFNIQRRFISPVIMGLIFNILLNIILIPSYGILGAAISIVISQGIILILTYSKLKKFLNFSIMPNMNKIIVSSAFMTILIYVMNLYEINLPTIIISGVLTYFGLLLLMKEHILQEVKSMIYTNN